MPTPPPPGPRAGSPRRRTARDRDTRSPITTSGLPPLWHRRLVFLSARRARLVRVPLDRELIAVTAREPHRRGQDESRRSAAPSIAALGGHLEDLHLARLLGIGHVGRPQRERAGRRDRGPGTRRTWIRQNPLGLSITDRSPPPQARHPRRRRRKLRGRREQHVGEQHLPPKLPPRLVAPRAPSPNAVPRSAPGASPPRAPRSPAATSSPPLALKPCVGRRFVKIT